MPATLRKPYARRQVIPLTTEQQRLAAEAWQRAQPVARYYERVYRRFGLDWNSAIALCFVERIRDYDPRKSEFAKWVFYQAHFACREYKRQQIRVASRSPYTRRVRFWPLDVLDQDAVDCLTCTDPEPESSQVTEANYLLRGLSPVQRTLIWESVVEGRKLRDIGHDLGVQEARACQIRTDTLAFLRRCGRGRE